jgi:hypothetical protein
MKISATFIVLLLVASPSLAQTTRTIPPGLLEAQKADDRAQQNEIPPQTQRPGPDLVKLRHDADELALLAQSIPQDVDQTAKGILRGDLSARLKKIEKLAKQLRSQLTP